jgi:hypothetical protein
MNFIFLVEVGLKLIFFIFSIYNKMDRDEKFLIFNEFDIEENNEDENCEENCEEICDHANTIDDSGILLCNDCGLEMCKLMIYEKDWKYNKAGSCDTKVLDSSRCFIRRNDDKTIFKDVENFGFSEKIVNVANDIYDKVTKGKIYRGNSRKAIVFGCIFNSCKITGMPHSCDLLREIFHLDRKIILRGLKYVNLNAPKTPININYITPIELINEYIRKNNLPEEQRLEIISLYNKTKDKSSVITRSRPQSIANSYIYFYMTKKLGANNFNLKEFAKKIKLSELTILKLCREINKIIIPVPKSSPKIIPTKKTVK